MTEESSLYPMMLVSVTLKSYWVPGVRPFTTTFVVNTLFEKTVKVEPEVSLKYTW